MHIRISEKAVPILESLQVAADDQQPVPFDTVAYSPRLFESLSRSSLAGIDGTELNRVHDRYLNIVGSTQQSLPTKYEDPLTYTWLCVLVKQLASAARELGYQLPESISLGTVSSGTINAHVVPLDRQKAEYLLVFNRDLFRFTRRFSRFIASAVYEHLGQYEAGELQEIGPSDEQAGLCRDVIYSLVNRINILRDNTGAVDCVMLVDLDAMGEPTLPDLKSQASTAFYELLYFAMNSFAVAHELAHVIRLQERANSVDEGAEPTTFNEELACDAIGSRIAAQTAARQCVGHYLDGWWQPAGTAGSLFFLSCLGLAERAAYVLQNGTKVPSVMIDVDPVLEANVVSSYPTALIRRHVVRVLLVDEIRRGVRPDSVKWIFGAHDWTAARLDRCWAKLEPEFLARSEGRKKMREEADCLLRQERETPSTTADVIQDKGIQPDFDAKEGSSAP
jgi:hypothetical protein